MSNSEEFSKDISRLCIIPMREYPYFLFPFLIVNQVSLYKHIVFSNFRGGILLFNTFELEHFLKALQNKLDQRRFFYNLGKQIFFAEYKSSTFKKW